jgi:hypothetical protein
LERSERFKMAKSLLRKGKSLEEVRVATGFSPGYIRNIKSDIKNPGTLKKSSDEYKARYPERVAETKRRWRRRNVKKINETNRRWRRKNKEARNRYRKDNYRRTVINATHSGERWLTRHLSRITAVDRPCDEVLSKELGRSVQAIQDMRYKLHK